MVFAKHTDEHLASLAKSMDELLQANADSKLMVVINLIGEDSEALKKAAAELGKDLKVVPVVVPVDHKTGPSKWKINAEAGVTVFMYKKKKVVGNMAFEAGKFDADAVKAVADAVPETLLK